MATARKQRINDRRTTRQLRFAAGIDKPQNAIALLKADHREVDGFFKAFKKAESDREKRDLAKKICDALTLHARIEEEVFYPAFIAATGNQDLHDEAVVEHASAKVLIAEIEAGAGTDPLFEAKVRVLSEMIKHHVREEERFGGMFTKARMAKMDLTALGALLEARKRELSAGSSGTTKGTPPGTRAAFMGAASLAKSEGRRPRARRAP